MTIAEILAKQPRLAMPAAQLIAELQTNRRAALGLLVIAALIALYGVMLLRGATERAIEAYGTEAAMLQRVTAVAQEKDWPLRATQSGAMLANMRQRLWTADSEGLAQADLQSWISTVGREIGLPIFDIRTEAAKVPNAPPDLWQITATITAQPSEPAVIALLERLAQPPHVTVVSRFHVRQQSGPMLELVLTGYARIASAAGAAGAAAGPPSPPLLQGKRS